MSAEDSVHTATALISSAPIVFFPLDPLRDALHGSKAQRCWVNCTLPVSKRQQKPTFFLHCFGVICCDPVCLQERRPPTCLYAACHHWFHPTTEKGAKKSLLLIVFHAPQNAQTNVSISDRKKLPRGRTCFFWERGDV